MSFKKVVVIGGGPGGYVAAIRASQLGAKVILIEKEKIGGTCLNRGCIPTKSLLFDAKLLRSIKHSPVFQSLFHEGFDPLKSMMERKKKVVQEMVKGIEILLESHRVNVKYGHADLLGDHQVVLRHREEKEEIFDADAIILAMGSKSKTIPHFTPDGERIITSDEALEIESLPSDITILGGGYIGMEFATLFSALGSRVTIVEILDSILTGLEPELVRNLKRVLDKQGMRVLTKSTIEEIRPKEEKLILTVKTPQGIQEVTAEKLLIAVGRAPNLNLDFSKAGVETTSIGIQVNQRMETTCSHIYAIGDVTGGPLLAHVASEEGIVAVENLMGIDRKFENRWIPACIFTDPEIASVGLTEKEAKTKGGIKIGRFPFRSNPRALISGETEGLIKVIASRETDELLGVHIIGSEASDLISIASSILRQGGRTKDFSQIIQAHPTLPEALKEACLDAEGMAIHLSSPLRERKG